VPLGSGWQEGTLNSIRSGIVSLDLWEFIEPFPETDQVRELLEVLRPDALEIFHSLSQLEVHESKIPQSPLLSLDEVVDIGSLGLDLLVENLLLLVIELLVEAQLDGGSEDIAQNAKNFGDNCLVLNGLAKQLGLVADGYKVVGDG
jgi:hypothetical protein